MKTISIPNKVSSFIAALVLLLLCCSEVSAQKVSTYTVINFNAGFSSIKGDGSSTIMSVGSYDDGIATMSLPFNFQYDGTIYSAGNTIMLATNGFLVLGSSIGTAVPDGNRYGVAWNVNNAIMPFSCDLLTLSNAQGCVYETTGSSPNRVLTFEWNTFNVYPGVGNQTNMQVKFYETSNTIEFWYSGAGTSYGSLPPTGDPSAGIIGLNGNPFSSDQNYANGSASSLPTSNLRFVSLPNTQLSSKPKFIAYGSLLAGAFLDNTVTVSNAGDAGTLNITGISITGAPDFTLVGPLPPPLQPGQSGTFTIRFSAQGSGVRTGNVGISSNGRDSGNQTVTVQGFTIAPSIAVDSTTRFKRTRTRLGDSLTQWIHITSVGAASLFFSSFQLIGGDASLYFISHFPTNPIPPGQTDSLAITFTPRAEGLHGASLVINSNAVNIPSDTISLRGTGILAHIVVTPPILLFDSTQEGTTVCKNISIWNAGSDTLKLFSNDFSSNDGDFHYTGLTLPADVNIPPDVTKTVQVCFTPIQQGERQARLLLKTSIPKTFETPRRDTAGTIFIDIRGTGVPFGVFANSLSGTNFADSAFIGKSACRIDTLKNTGDADIVVKGISVTPANFTYSGLPAFPFILKAHSSRTYSICGTPDVQGLINGTATVSGTTGGSNITFPIDLHIFGIKPCISANPDKLFETTVLPNNGSDSTLCVTITNCGDIPAIYHVAISGTNAAQYTVTPSVSGTVVAQTGTTIFCVKYKPTAVGASPASLDVTAEDGSTSVSVPLSGSAGCAVLTNANPEVPNTGEGGKQTFTFTITNSGSFDWTPGLENLAGTGATAFKLISITPLPIPVGGQGTVTMEFDPPAGTKGTTFTAQLTWPNAGPCGSLDAITLNGNSVLNGVTMDATADGFSLDQSYPNPTKGNATFTYSTPKETEVRISLVDLTGKLVRTLITGRVSEGPHIVNFDAAGLASGTYIYMLESGSTRLVKQLILTR